MADWLAAQKVWILISSVIICGRGKPFGAVLLCLSAVRKHAGILSSGQEGIKHCDFSASLSMEMWWA